MLRLAVIGWIGLALIAGGCSWWSSPPPNLLLISVDTLRADHLGIYGYPRGTSPHIDAFFHTGTVFEHAHSTEANTPQSVASFLSGLQPQDTGVRLFYQKVPADLRLISEDLADHGYQTGAIVSNLVLTREATSLDAHFGYYDDYVDQIEPYRNVYERNATGTTNAGLLWMKEEHVEGMPFLLWIHYQDPHGPYHPPADKPRDFEHDEPREIDLLSVPSYQREPGVTDGLEYIDLYDEEIAYLDHELGRLLQAFAEQGLLENTIVAFTADHGESMMEHERWFTHGYHVYNEITHVPLLIRHPQDETQRRIPARVSLVDLVPTLLHHLDVTPTRTLRGQSLNQPIRMLPVYSQGEQNRSMILGDRKWVIAVEGVVDGEVLGQKRVYYDLAQDPQETDPRPWSEAGAEPEVFLAMIAEDPSPTGRPTGYERGERIRAPKVRPGLDEGTLEKLRSLGYVE